MIKTKQGLDLDYGYQDHRATACSLEQQIAQLISQCTAAYHRGQWFIAAGSFCCELIDFAAAFNDCFLHFALINKALGL